MCIILVVIPGEWKVDVFLPLYHKIFPVVSVYPRLCETLLHSIPPAVVQVNTFDHRVRAGAGVVFTLLLRMVVVFFGQVPKREPGSFYLFISVHVFFGQVARKIMQQYMGKKRDHLFN